MGSLFEVEQVLAMRKAKGGAGMEYRIRWRGFGAKDDTWEAARTIEAQVPALVHAFRLASVKKLVRELVPVKVISRRRAAAPRVERLKFVASISVLAAKFVSPKKRGAPSTPPRSRAGGSRPISPVPYWHPSGVRTIRRGTSMIIRAAGALSLIEAGAICSSGVTKEPGTNRWSARIERDGEWRELGSDFSSEEAAAAAYAEANVQHRAAEAVMALSMAFPGLAGSPGFAPKTLSGPFIISEDNTLREQPTFQSLPRELRSLCQLFLEKDSDIVPLEAVRTIRRGTSMIIRAAGALSLIEAGAICSVKSDGRVGYLHFLGSCNPGLGHETALMMRASHYLIAAGCTRLELDAKLPDATAHTSQQKTFAKLFCETLLQNDRALLRNDPVSFYTGCGCVIDSSVEAQGRKPGCIAMVGNVNDIARHCSHKSGGIGHSVEVLQASTTSQAVIRGVVSAAGTWKIHV